MAPAPARTQTRKSDRTWLAMLLGGLGGIVTAALLVFGTGRWAGASETRVQGLEDRVARIEGTLERKLERMDGMLQELRDRTARIEGKLDKR